VPSKEEFKLPYEQLAISFGWESIMREACPLDTAVAAYIALTSACEQLQMDVTAVFHECHAVASRGMLKRFMLEHYRDSHGQNYDL